MATRNHFFPSNNLLNPKLKIYGNSSTSDGPRTIIHEYENLPYFISRPYKSVGQQSVTKQGFHFSQIAYLTSAKASNIVTGK